MIIICFFLLILHVFGHAQNQGVRGNLREYTRLSVCYWGSDWVNVAVRSGCMLLTFVFLHGAPQKISSNFCASFIMAQDILRPSKTNILNVTQVT